MQVEEHKQKLREISGGNEKVLPITKHFLAKFQDVMALDWGDLMRYDIRLQPLTDGRKGFIVVFKSEVKENIV